MWYKYGWIWNKGKAGNIFTAKLYPLITHEDILVFSNGNMANGSNKNMIYYPQMIALDKPQKYSMNINNEKSFARKSHKSIKLERTHKYPKSIIDVFNGNAKGKLHPTQKPVELLEYLIKTYTKEKDVILDNVMGSGSTGVACINTNRKFIGIEKDNKYFKIAKKRIEGLL